MFYIFVFLITFLAAVAGFYYLSIKKTKTKKKIVPVERVGNIRRPNINTGRQANVTVDSDINESKGKNIGTKKAAKLAEKERKREEREALERYRAHQEKLEEQAYLKRKAEEKKQEQLEAEEEAKIQQQLAEKEAREQREYENLKTQFSVEDEGHDTIDASDSQMNELIDTIISHVKKEKRVIVEHLALEFNLKTNVCVNLLQKLISDGSLTGVLDDRGVFIYISPEEYKNVVSFIANRGRVALSELADNTSRLINIPC